MTDKGEKVVIVACVVLALVGLCMGFHTSSVLVRTMFMAGAVACAAGALIVAIVRGINRRGGM